VSSKKPPTASWSTCNLRISTECGRKAAFSGGFSAKTRKKCASAKESQVKKWLFVAQGAEAANG
jgi:hypothetical protein